MEGKMASTGTARSGSADDARSGRGRALNPEEFEARYTACSATLWCIAAGVLGDRALAEDVIQEAAMIALQKLDQFDPASEGTSFVAWLGQFVRFVALNTARKQVRAAAQPFDPADIDRGIGLSADGAGTGRTRAAHPSPVNQRGELVPDQCEFDDQVMTGLRSLAPAARACLLLRTVCELPYREIALALDMPEGTVMSHVHRSRKHLRHCVAAPQDREKEAASAATERES
jgi:RNA polymerase sigma-70 factor, ECF subfamily